MAPGQVLRDKTAKSAPVYREMGRDHSSDEDFVVDQAAPDLDDSPDDSPNEGPPRKKTRTQGRPDVQARSKKERKPAVRSTRGRVSKLKLTPDTQKTPPTTKPTRRRCRQPRTRRRPRPPLRRILRSRSRLSVMGRPIPSRPRCRNRPHHVCRNRRSRRHQRRNLITLQPSEPLVNRS
ncbi:hypothetical protein PR002_g6265 [Phytophthora rubi]|uniref:Uncharacterized protein n=1 Tax=Phytophthora rubi TaxID=129364 RepID=A0A6A3N2V3_9STRA|nr:hypothetical protein PR002_g6265 [Phytophthora rubi]